ncbi:hypothetical protein [Pilosibacter fragilis]|jgi:hypothetical protein|uniref:hypothetical protein n=1 Tax=Pilosibacter fragilis TaxID=3078042 RepID=UPI001C019B04|nr:hypothetical protein [Enterocloster bolteae]MBT9830228.1 hypothetical protein [Enterocloster bolteae]
MGKDGIRRFDDYSMEELLSMPPEELMAAASNRFKLDLPPSIDTVDNLNKLAKLMSKSISEYSYLINMAQIARMRKRALKRSGADKFTVEDALTREEIFTNYAEIMKAAYQAASRMITVKQEINEELKFTDGR